MDSSDERMPYLRAIQKVPGDTASEKLSWLSRCAHQQTGENQVPSELLPLYRVEVAVKTKNYEEITSALKSENLTLINRALKAAWFFDGSHKKIIDDVYFVQHIFPYVSAIARKRIVNALAYRTIGRDTEFAQRMFTVVMLLYDIQTSYPLLLASGEEFAYETIVKEKHALPCRMLKKIWRAYPNLVIRYLKVLSPHGGSVNRLAKSFGVTIHKYKSFLPSLVKTRTEDFAELCVKNQCSLRSKLSNTAADVFLKKAQSYFVKHPQLFINMLPLKKINAELMKTVFPCLLPEEKYSFKTDRMLEYLEYYPKDKKWELLYKSYKMAYSAELTASTDNITFELLRVVPAEERVNLARRLLGDNITSKNDCETNYTKCLICYLSTDEALPVLKEKIKYTSDSLERHCYILHMFYNCKINDDNDALADTLDYFLRRHKNEDAKPLGDTITHIQQFFDIPRLNKKLCSSILEILQLYIAKYSFINMKLAEDLVHHRLIHGMPITDLIKMITDLGFNKVYIYFTMLTKYPEYERQCLLVFLEIIQHEKSHDEYSMEQRIRLVEAMYAFNDRCEKSKTKIKRMTIMDYPWLINLIKYCFRDSSSSSSTISFTLSKLKRLLKTNERKLYDELFGEEEKRTKKVIIDVTSGKVLRLLTQNPQSIADDWQIYYEQCNTKRKSKFVQRFVKATRWYKYIPIAFAEHCVEILEEAISENVIRKVPFAIVALSLLLHGDSLTKLIDPLLPTEKIMRFKSPDMWKRCKIVKLLCHGINLSNPPVPLDLVARMCRGDYLSVALWSATNISKRSSIPKVEAFAQNLLNMRIGTRKHGITVMNSVISERQQIDFYQKMWTTEKHHSMRDIVFNNIHKLFAKSPTPETWNLYAGAISTLNEKDEKFRFKSINDIPEEYIDKYMKVWFDMLDKVIDIENTIMIYLNSLTKMSVCNLVSEELVAQVLKRFLFYDRDDNISRQAIQVAIVCLTSDDKKKLAPRIKIVMDIVLDAIRNYWNSKSLKNALRELIFDLVHHPVDTQVIDNMLTIFSIVPPIQLAQSYLLLTYAKRLKKNCNPQEAHDFGLKLGQEITDIPFFSPLLVSYLADILKQFLTTCVVKNSSRESIDRWILNRRKTPTEAICVQILSKPAQSEYEVQLNVIEGLIEANNSYSSFIGLAILEKLNYDKKYEQKYCRLIETFRKMQEDPAIMTKFYESFI